MKHWKALAATILFAAFAIWILSAQSVSQVRVIGQPPIIHDRVFLLEDVLKQTLYRVERLEATVKQHEASIESLKKTNSAQAAQLKKLQGNTLTAQSTKRKQ
ncbi:MAG: hypothetical protein KF784_07160 [Fimbriimonadaceae bacterium]|nr:hypothetical protein [Fimbriimonadaceae bacterium]